MTLSEKRADFTKMLMRLQVFAVSRASYHGVLLYIDYIKRHKCAQQGLFNEGVSWTLDSLHLDGLAADFYVVSKDSRRVLMNHEILDEMGEFWIDESGEWGGEKRWIEKGHTDRGHFQYNRKRRQKYEKENQNSRGDPGGETSLQDTGGQDDAGSARSTPAEGEHLEPHRSDNPQEERTDRKFSVCSW